MLDASSPGSLEDRLLVAIAAREDQGGEISSTVKLPEKTASSVQMQEA